MFDVLYQDEQLIAINKPEKWLVHRSAIDKYETRFVVQALRDQIGQFVFPVHRLDKPTSGVLLFALTSDIATQVSNAFAQHTIDKRYILLSRGWVEASGYIDHALVPKSDFKTAKKKPAKPAQDAQTYFKCLAQYELPFEVDRYPQSRYSLVEAKPITGRKHQLRRHFKHLAHPLIGDPKYGKTSHNRFFKDQFESDRLLLHCSSMALRHPVKKDVVRIKAPMPASFSDLLAKLAPFEV